MPNKRSLSFGKSGQVTNWTGNQQCLPGQVIQAGSAEEIAEVTRAASASGGRVKAIGAGHSFTGAAMTDGTLVRVDGLDNVVEFDGSSGVVLVGAGMRLHELSLHLDDLGRALPNLGDIDVQTVAGATATATHGTGTELGNLSSGIAGFELVAGTGEVLWCDSDSNPELFRVGRVGIGALGVLTKVAIQTVPAFNLHAVEGPEAVDDVLRDWKGFRESADHVEFFWLPGEPVAFVKRNARTEAPAEPCSRLRFFGEKILLENAAFGASQRIVRRFPSTRDRVAKTLSSAVAPSEHTDASFRIFASPRKVKFMECEYGIPIDALPEAFDRVRKHAESLALPSAFPVEVRCSAADDIPLSTAYGRDTGWIAVHQYVGMPYGDYFRGVEQIMADYDGRPHWGKHHGQSAESLRPRYPEWDAFQQVRAEVDPAGVFANDYLDRVLGVVSRRG